MIFQVSHKLSVAKTQIIMNGCMDRPKNRMSSTDYHQRRQKNCLTTDLYKVLDAVPPIHAVSSHAATDKGPSKFRSIFSDNLQPIATRGKKARGMLLVNIGCSSKRVPLSVSYHNEIIGSCRCSEEGLCWPSTAPMCPTYNSEFFEC